MWHPSMNVESIPLPPDSKLNNEKSVVPNSEVNLPRAQENVEREMGGKIEERIKMKQAGVVNVKGWRAEQAMYQPTQHNKMAMSWNVDSNFATNNIPSIGIPLRGASYMSDRSDDRRVMNYIDGAALSMERVAIDRPRVLMRSGFDTSRTSGPRPVAMSYVVRSKRNLHINKNQSIFKKIKSAKHSKGCLFCKDVGHSAQHCTTYPDVESRVRFLDENQLCRACAFKHDGKRCQNCFKKCKICNEKNHLLAICQGRQVSTLSIIPTTASVQNRNEALELKTERGANATPSTNMLKGSSNEDETKWKKQ